MLQYVHWLIASFVCLLFGVVYCGVIQLMRVEFGQKTNTMS